MEQACEEQIREQTEELLSRYGLKLVECVSRVDLEGRSPGIRFLHVRARRRGEEESGDTRGGILIPEPDTAQQIRERLAGIYELEESLVEVWVS